jgi:small subunit ribosomal protein S21
LETDFAGMALASRAGAKSPQEAIGEVVLPPIGPAEFRFPGAVGSPNSSGTTGWAAFWGNEAAFFGGEAVFFWRHRKNASAGFALTKRICHIPLPVANPTEAVQCRPLEVQVGDRGIERAIKHLKRKMAAEGTLRELKRRRHYMKPSIKIRKKIAEAARRRRKRVRPEEPRL